MQLISADIGNSSTKLSIHAGPGDNRWCDQYVFRGDDAIQLDLTREDAFWSICSVDNKGLKRLETWIQKNRPTDRIYVISDEDIELRTNVVTRKRVGLDRLLAAWMALTMCDNIGPLIVVDAGTAVTIDFVSQNKVFEGGVIFPGASVNLKYLSAATDVLPDLSEHRHLYQVGNLENEVIGRDTELAILIGVYQAQIGSIQHIVDKMREDLEFECPVYATGGGVLAVEKYLPPQWKVVPDLVLQGARQIGLSVMKDLTSSKLPRT